MDEARLAEYLSTQSGASVDVHESRRLTVGHSRAMYDVETSAGRFVVRKEQGGVFGTSSAAEFNLMQSLHAAGFPVANVRWLESTGKVLGQPFFVMDYIDAEQPADERAMDPATAAAFVRTLASLHALDPTAHLPTVDPEQTTHIQIEHWRNVGKSAGGQRIPLLDAAEMWLHQRAPLSRRVTLVHGDPGPGNVLSSHGEILALTDWEFAHVGDPAEDWSFCLSMRGARTMSRDAWLTLFEQEAGIEMAPEQWAYWEAFNLYKGACANRTCLGVFESGANRSPNMAIIGTAMHHAFLRRLVDITR
ncbi:MAG: phosphotransferase family protein [Ilumatobacteraceae bacterium]